MARAFPGTILSGPVLFRSIRDQFKNVPDFRNPLRIEIPIQDFFMSAFSVFALKLPSLLQYEEQMRLENRKTNLAELFYVDRAPSDTHMRTVIDEYSNDVFRPVFSSVFERVRREKPKIEWKFTSGDARKKFKHGRSRGRFKLAEY